jgi:hypothetical protein
LSVVHHADEHDITVNTMIAAMKKKSTRISRSLI